MSPPHEKLAASLAVLGELQKDGRRVFRSAEIGRVHRERLVRNGFLRDVIKGWLISTSPHSNDGDTTPWYASFWEFCALYCRERFDTHWHLSPEQSLLLHGEANAIPAQVIISSPKGTNNMVRLLFGTSLYDLKQKQMPPPEDIVENRGLRLFAIEAALIKVPEAFFQRSAVEAQVALASIRDVSAILGRLLEGGHSAVAGRLAGAFRRGGRSAFADEIVKTMKVAGYDVRESDPFEPRQDVQPIRPGIAPVVGRLQAIWETHRQAVIDIFQAAPGLPADPTAYLKFVEEIYQSDAYHSLSIEGYSVTPALIDRVRQGDWNPQGSEEDRKSRDALAARGYWQAFQEVKNAVASIIGGTPAGDLVRDAHRDWYRELFQPSVAAGILRPAALAGYRTHPVYLRGSRHVPPRAETVADAMSALFDLLEREPEPSVRVVLGHWLFGYIHPYPDGNGRIARFLMNAMLASGGYPWTVIRVDDRASYLAALEAASVQLDIRPFAAFIFGRITWSPDKGKTGSG
jgi:fido (protein-threonine AMPylation protein)